MDSCIVLTTVADTDAATRIAKLLVEEDMAACVNFFPVSSVYRWKGGVQQEDEIQLVIKTAEPDAVRERLEDVHPYDLPEIVFVGIKGGSEEYLKWLQ